MSNLVELKPCPFCGGKNPSLYLNGEYDYWYLHCDKCSASVGKSNLPDLEYDEYDVDDSCGDNLMDLVAEGKIKGIQPVIDAWNRRTP